MKMLKPVFLVIVASFDVYAFILWVIAVSQTESHKDAVEFFLNGWPWVNSVIGLSLFLILLSISALIIVNVKPFRKQIVTFTFSTIYILFLLYSLWGYL